MLAASLAAIANSIRCWSMIENLVLYPVAAMRIADN